MNERLVQLDAQALAQRFADGTATPIACLKQCLVQIERFDATLGVINQLESTQRLMSAAEAATHRWRIGSPKSELDGVPFLAKANIAIEGLPWHAGIEALRDQVAQEDASVIATLRSAGMIPLGIANMHEAALGETSDNPAFRRTLNPHHCGHIAGGSSGGSAAAVAAGMAPIALGTDDMGSVRLPSAFCGVVGFKGAFGEVPTQGVIPLATTLDHVGFHTRSVADVTALMALFSDAEPKWAAHAQPSARWVLGPKLGVTAEIEAVIDQACRDLTMQPSVDWSDVDLSKVRRAGLLLCERAASDYFTSLLAENVQGFSEQFVQLVSWGAAQSLDKVTSSRTLLNEIAQRLLGDLNETLLLSATTTHTAPEVGGVLPTTLADITAPAAVAGAPAISIPVGLSEAGLPIGLQIMGDSTPAVLAAAAGILPGCVPIAKPCC